MKIIFLLVAVALAGCTMVTPDAGHEAVLIEKPLIFGHGGVESSPVRTGRSIVAFTTDYVLVSMQPQQFPVHFDDLMSSDGVPLDFDAVIRLQVTDSVRLIKDFGPDWFKSNVLAEMMNRVRQAVRKHGMNETAIDTKAIEAIDNEVSAGMESYLKEANLPLHLIQVTVGRANPPDSIKSQRIATATEQQRQMTEQQRKLAEDQRKAAEKSRADADNAYREAMQLTPEQFLRLETIKMQHAVCSKGGTCTFLIGSGVTPVLNVRDK